MPSPAAPWAWPLSIGVAVSVGLAMVRVLTGISIFWFLVPGYAVAIALSFFVPKLFTAIAFDAGGVASGPMTATFLLPLAHGRLLGGRRQYRHRRLRRGRHGRHDAAHHHSGLGSHFRLRKSMVQWLAAPASVSARCVRLPDDLAIIDL